MGYQLGRILLTATVLATMLGGCGGEDGAPGANGDSCTVADNGDGTSTITCEDGTTATVSEGMDGTSCTLTASDAGVSTLTCDDGTTVELPSGSAAVTGYAGSEACMTCHGDKYNAWVNSAHPYKIVPKDEIVAGTGYPEWVQSLQGELFAVDADFFTDQASLMSTDVFDADSWDDISYVIGGYGWKARFMDADGWIITGTDHGTPGDTSDDDRVQYNLPYTPNLIGSSAYSPVAASSATYHTGEMKPYDCGTCHTTGWIPDRDAETDGDLSDNQDGLAGIWGTWVEPGIGCEACHGPSAAHAAMPNAVPPPQDPNNSCGDCHIRGNPYQIDTSGGFIKHHEQFEELVNSQHAAIGCEGCHDAHQPMRYGAEYVALDGTGNDPNPDYPNMPGIRMECTNCHFEQARTYAEWATDQSGGSGMDLSSMAIVDCNQCHMPAIAKSAVKAGDYHGDVASHLFAINTAIDPATDPTLTTAGANPANPYITIEWACGGCHQDEVGDDLANAHDWATTALEANGGVHGGN